MSWQGNGITLSPQSKLRTRFSRLQSYLKKRKTTNISKNMFFCVVADILSELILLAFAIDELWD